MMLCLVPPTIEPTVTTAALVGLTSRLTIVWSDMIKSAAWTTGSAVMMIDNDVAGWRHALHSTEGRVSAKRNPLSKFHRAAFVIQKPASDPLVSENEIMIASPSDQVCLIDEKPAAADANRLMRSLQH